MPYKDKQKEKEYLERNKEKIAAKKKEWAERNKERLKEKHKQYCEDNKERLAEYKKEYAEQNKEVLKQKQKEWRKLNKEKLKQDKKEYYENNKEKEKKRKEEWRLKNKEKINQRAVERRNNNPKLKIDQNISTAINKHIKNIKDNKHWEVLVGYTLEQLMQHLESLFSDGMSWDNYGSHWHIDHIKPKSWFLYESLEDAAFKECWALSNLQPLEASINCSKGNKYEG